MLAVTSTIADYRRLAEIAATGRARAWRQEYEAAHPAIFSCYYTRHGHPGRRGEAAARVAKLAPQIDQRQARVLAALDRACEDAVRHGLIAEDATINVVVMVGSGSSDAWVEAFQGRPTLFVALEMLNDPTQDEVLVMHEVIHLAHYHTLWPILSVQPNLDDQVGFRVWAEGLAVAGTRRLRPGHPNSAYLSAPSPHFMNDCHDNLPTIAEALIPSLSRVDPRLASRLCDNSEGRPWPNRAGYWLGDTIACELLRQGHALADLLSWKPDRVVDAMRRSAILAPFDAVATRSTST